MFKLGRNLHTIRSTLLKDAMSKGEPYNTMCPNIGEAILGEIDQQQPKLLAGAQTVFDDIIDDFKSLFIVEERPDPSRDSFKYEVQEFVRYAYEIINGPITRELAVAMAESEG